MSAMVRMKWWAEGPAFVLCNSITVTLNCSVNQLDRGKILLQVKDIKNTPKISKYTCGEVLWLLQVQVQVQIHLLSCGSGYCEIICSREAT